MPRTGYYVTRRTGWDGGENTVSASYIVSSSSTSGIRPISAQITKDISSYPSLNLTLDPSHREYDNFYLFTSFVKVMRIDTGKVLFEGRTISSQDSMDTSGALQKQITCESLEGFLHDSVPPFHEFHNTTVRSFLQWLITEHNKQVESYKRIKLGTITMTNSTDNVYRFTDDSKDTYDNIQDKLISRIGGEIRIRHEHSGLFLDYMPEISETNSQKIELAQNMLSLSRMVDPSSVVTILKPLGATQEPKEGSNESQDVAYPHLTVSSVNGGSPYLRDEKLIKLFGEQTKTNTWDDVTTAKALLTKGKEFMASQANIKMQLQVSYIDLSHVTPDKFEEFDVGQVINIKNALQGIDVTKRIVGMNIDLLNIASSTITIGDTSMTGSGYERMWKKEKNQENQEFINKFNYQQQQINKMKKDLEALHSDVSDWQPGGLFIDISSNNGSHDDSWYTSLKNEGIKGAIIKLTENTNYVNELFDSQKSQVIKAKMKFIGTYHMLTAKTTDEATNEATWYVKQLKAKNISKNTVVSCDIEIPQLPSDKATLNAVISSFYAVLAKNGYSNTADYSSTSWYNDRFTPQATYSWIADWDATKRPTGADAWQYTTKFNGNDLDVNKSYNQIFV